MRIFIVIGLAALPFGLHAQSTRGVGNLADMHLQRALSTISAADESLSLLQTTLERDAAVLAKLREAREVLEEDTQPMTVVNAVAVRVADAERMRPHPRVLNELDPVKSTLDDFRRSSANIDLPLLTRRVDEVLNTASDVVVEDVRALQPVLATLIRMQDALQARLSGMIQSQARAMELTARTGR